MGRSVCARVLRRGFGASHAHTLGQDWRDVHRIWISLVTSFHTVAVALELAGKALFRPFRLVSEPEWREALVKVLSKLGSETMDPPGCFMALHVLRSDAESINSHLEGTLYLRRASAKGWRRLLVDLFGYARVVNAETLARARARSSIEPAA